MIIGKLFEFENAHIVRDCSSKRCKYSIHGHSYKLEIQLESKQLDRAGMVYDFGLLKQEIKELVDSFDHAITLFSGDDSEYLEAMKRHSKRYVILPINASAENFCRVFFVLIDKLLSQTKMQNGEQGVRLKSVVVHETRTGWAQGFREDAYNENLAPIDLNAIEFSPEIVAEWSDARLFERLKRGEIFINKKEL